MQEIFIYAAVLLVAVPLYWIVPAPWRGTALLVGSVAVIARVDWISAVYFLVMVGLTFYAGRYLRDREAARRSALFRLMLLWLIGNLCWFKYTNQAVAWLLSLGAASWVSLEPGTSLPRVVMPLGASYIIFRMIHYTVEIYRGRIPQSSLADFALYVLFIPTYVAGPVERFPAFQKQTAAQKKLDHSDINYGLFRIISGLVKKFLVAESLKPLIIGDPAARVLGVLLAPAAHGKAVVVSSLYGLAVMVYMDFSGYTDLALGVAMLFGYKIMENFNLPYFKPNLAEMWRNWHISVYSFIRDYFFFPFFGVRASFFKMQLGVILTFVVFMVWHEGSWRFLALGLYHGLGMVTWNVFQQLKRKNAALRDLINHKDLRPLHTFIAFSFFGFGFIFFFLDMDGVVALVARLLM